MSADVRAEEFQFPQHRKALFVGALKAKVNFNVELMSSKIQIAG